MKDSKEQQLIDQLQVMRYGGDNAVCVIITATSGEIRIMKQQTVDSVLDFLIKELRTDIAKDLENE